MQGGVMGWSISGYWWLALHFFDNESVGPGGQLTSLRVEPVLESGSAASVSPCWWEDYRSYKHHVPSVQWSNIAGVSAGNVGKLPGDDGEMVATAAEGPAVRSITKGAHPYWWIELGRLLANYHLLQGVVGWGYVQVILNNAWWMWRSNATSRAKCVTQYCLAHEVLNV